MFNSITVMGRTTSDIELKQTQNGVAVASFTLAVDRERKDANGERQTDFISVVAWRGTAEIAAKYFPKGRMMLVSGSLQSRKYQDKEGNNRIAWEVVADRICFCGDGKKEGGGVPAQPAQMPAQQGGYAPQQMPMQQPVQGGYAPMPQQMPMQQMQGYGQQPAQQGGYAPMPQQGVVQDTNGAPVQQMPAQPAQQGGYAPQQAPQQAQVYQYPVSGGFVPLAEEGDLPF